MMIDRENVIKGLEIHTKPNSRCIGCPYPNNGLCGDQLYRDALALLKEQEAQNECLMKKCVICPHCKNCDVDENGLPKTGKWILEDEDSNSWECSECGALQQIIDGTPYENGWYFCPHCGTKLDEQVVKWE